MAALPVIAGVFRVALFWLDGTGQRAVNVLHFQKTGGTVALLNAALDGAATGSMWAYTRATASVVSKHITPLDGSSATAIYAASGASWVGGQSTGDFMPACAEVVSLRTSKRGKSYRGRVFLPFIAESVAQNGSITGSVGTQQAAWTAFVSDMATATYPLVVASYKLATADLVQTTLVENVLGTIRGRQSRLR